MAALNPYITFNGNCEEAFNFYRSAFGGDFAMISRFGDVPSEVQYTLEEARKIMHVSLPIGNGTFLFGSDRPASVGNGSMGDNIAISIDTESEKEADRIFNGLSAGGKVTMPLAKTFWGAYFGMLTDSFGVHWMVNFDYKQEK